MTVEHLNVSESKRVLKSKPGVHIDEVSERNGLQGKEVPTATKEEI